MVHDWLLNLVLTGSCMKVKENLTTIFEVSHFDTEKPDGLCDSYFMFFYPLKHIR